jgi:hypothetical protein
MFFSSEAGVKISTKYLNPASMDVFNHCPDRVQKKWVGHTTTTRWWLATRSSVESTNRAITTKQRKKNEIWQTGMEVME